MKQDFEKGKQRKTKMRYMPGLDGLRAILCLRYYHLPFKQEMAYRWFHRSRYLLRYFWIFNHKFTFKGIRRARYY